MQAPLSTNRLLITPLTLNDNKFIFELVNTDGWIKFIGNRNVTSAIAATEYIQKIIDNPHTNYWVVRLPTNYQPIGVITLIKRTYLEHHDIGFAFLPGFSKKGYAYEAAKAVLNEVVHSYNLSQVLATTMAENVNSIKLLKKLGLVFNKEIEVDKIKLHVYSSGNLSGQSINS